MTERFIVRADDGSIDVEISKDMISAGSHAMRDARKANNTEDFTVARIFAAMVVASQDHARLSSGQLLN